MVLGLGVIMAASNAGLPASPDGQPKTGAVLPALYTNESGSCDPQGRLLIQPTTLWLTSGGGTCACAAMADMALIIIKVRVDRFMCVS